MSNLNNKSEQKLKTRRNVRELFMEIEIDRYMDSKRMNWNFVEQ